MADNVKCPTVSHAMGFFFFKFFCCETKLLLNTLIYNSLKACVCMALNCPPQLSDKKRPGEHWKGSLYCLKSLLVLHKGMEHIGWGRGMVKSSLRLNKKLMYITWRCNSGIAA